MPIKLTLITILYSCIFLETCCSVENNLKERLWKSGEIEHLMQSDKVSCGVFLLKVCDIFLRGGTWEKIKSDYSIVLITLLYL